MASDAKHAATVAPKPALYVLLVRHGESESNAAGRFAFKTWDPGLTARGLQQAESLVAQLTGAPVVRIVSSPLRRAKETLTPLAEARQLPIEELPQLAELNMGQWDGKVLKDLARQEPTEWQAWRRDPEANPPPRGERISMVGTRVMEGLETLRGTSGLVVAGTHADCIKGVVVDLLKATGPGSRRLQVPNLGQVLIRATDTGSWMLCLMPVSLRELGSS